jgi:serine/threonine-protein kinase HipA
MILANFSGIRFIHLPILPRGPLIDQWPQQPTNSTKLRAACNLLLYPLYLPREPQGFGQFPNDKYHFYNYSNIASVLWAEAGEDAIVEFVRRLVFSVVIGNADMHLKNWSLLYPDRRKPVLSAGYDFVATLPYIPNDTLTLSFGGSRSLSEITPGQMRRFADTARIPASPLWKIAVETAERAAAAWKGLERADLLPMDRRASIGDKQILAVAATVK